MDVVYIHHDQIDATSHTSDSKVFSACDKAIDEIKSLVRILVNEFSATLSYSFLHQLESSNLLLSIYNTSICLRELYPYLIIS